MLMSIFSIFVLDVHVYDYFHLLDTIVYTCIELYNILLYFSKSTKHLVR